MGYQDRGYSGGGGGGGGDFLLKLRMFFNYSFPIGTYAGIRVRIHITFLLLLAIEMLVQGDPMWTIRWTTLLFGSVLLHEFGHALACRAVGGQADDILLWPLGGLAFCAPPRRPWPEFVTVACGPLVNVVLCGLSAGLMMTLWDRPLALSPNPFIMFIDDSWSGWYRLLYELFCLNYLLLIFNLVLVFYPFDGGRLVQIGLWKLLGYEKSMRIATVIGMVGAIGIVLTGMALGFLLLMFIGIFGFMTCYQQRVGLVSDPYASSSYGGGGYATYGQSVNEGFFARRRLARAEKQRKQRLAKAQKLEAEVDRILEKVHREGINALTAKEKKTLADATENQRGGR